MTPEEAMTTLRGIRDSLASLPGGPATQATAQGGSARASGVIVANGPATIQATGGSATVNVTQEGGQEMAAIIGQIIDELENKKDQNRIRPLVESLSQYAYIGAVVIECVKTFLPNLMG